MYSILSPKIAIGATAALSLLASAACEFDPKGIPPTAMIGWSEPEIYDQTKTDHDVKFSSPGELFVVHGKECARDNPQEWSHLVGLETTVALPSSDFVAATVVLNGWRFRFLDEETEIIGFGAGLGETVVKDSQAHWNAIGSIYTEDIKQAVEFCYYFTLVAWTDFVTNGFVIEEPLSDIESYENSAQSSALFGVARYLHRPEFDGTKFVGVLPRGFGMLWADYDYETFLQSAYHLKPSERFIYDSLDVGMPVRRSTPGYVPKPSLPHPVKPPTPVDLFDSGFVSWESAAIFKNEDDPDPFRFGDIVAGIAGDQFDLVEPHFGIEPDMEVPWWDGYVGTMNLGNPQFQTYAIRNLPHHFALPVLSGWNIELPFDDEEVRQIGVWIEDFDFRREPSTGAGLLTYQIAYVFDDDDDSECYLEPGIAVFGVNELYPD